MLKSKRAYVRNIIFAEIYLEGGEPGDSPLDWPWNIGIGKMYYNGLFSSISSFKTKGGLVAPHSSLAQLVY